MRSAKEKEEKENFHTKNRAVILFEKCYLGAAMTVSKSDPDKKPAGPLKDGR